ncbi:MAG: quinolinate synthase NadA [Spirochaetaceae bacterium]|nr:MAG: quinolinate synthase NadA [Spirochaetaceae bacterium]
MDTEEKIEKIKKELEGKVCILAHYYQRDEVYRHADITGDSYALAVASSRTVASNIIFCGVYFMAESARILCRKDQKVFLPEKEAGCPLADMAGRSDFEKLYAELDNKSSPLVPVVYVNSSIGLKAAAGLRAGITCTSSNAAMLVKQVLDEGKRVFFLPDYNLGLNTAFELGVPENEIGSVKKNGEKTNISPQTRMILWDGFCNVHVRFSVMDIRLAKNKFPYSRVLVHPECPRDVVAEADFAGSTSQIIAEVEKTKPGETVFIGTEYNLVQRLGKLHKDFTVLPLRKSECVNMNKITEGKLLSVLEAIKRGDDSGQVTVDESEKINAHLTLEEMIARVEKGKAK